MSDDPGPDFWSTIEDICDQATRAWATDPRPQYVEIQICKADLDVLRASYTNPPDRAASPALPGGDDVRRCPWALRINETYHTRCDKIAGHDEHRHEGPGLAEFPDQRISWLLGDGREYLTERDDVHAWAEL